MADAGGICAGGYFDAQQRQTSERKRSPSWRTENPVLSRPVAHFEGVVRQGGIYHEILEEAAAVKGRPDRG